MSPGVLHGLSLAALLVSLSGGCSSLRHPTATSRLEIAVALPVEIAATITAAAVRAALPFADPMAPTLAAPVTRHAAGDFEVCYEQDGAGHWLPRADRRLAIEVPAAADLPVLVRQQREPNPGFGPRARHRLTVRVQAAGSGALVAGELPPPVLQAVTQALALAVDPDGALPGLSEPNLGAYVGHRLWQAARRATANGDDTGARTLLQRAARLPAAPADLLGELARFAGDAGDSAAANDLGLLAVAAARDPLRRSQLAQAVAARRTDGHSSASMRRLAEQRLRRGDLAGAERLLHTARREDPRPALDYRLLSLLQERRCHDDAWASALLATEHARAAGPPAGTPWFELARPMLAIAFPHLAATPAAAAAPGR